MPSSAATAGSTSPRRRIGRRRRSSGPSWRCPGHGLEPARRRPATTVDAATSAGSRSSSVVVVTNAWGSSPMRRTRCARRSGSSSLKTSSSSSSGGRPSAAASRSSCGQLEGEDRRALLAARREAGQVAPVELERDVVAVRPDERRRRSRAPSRRSRRAGAGGRRAVVSSGRRRRVGQVAQLEAALAGRDLGVRRGERPGQRRERRAPPVDDLRRPRRRRTPSQKRSSSGAAAPSRIAPQQVVALGQGAGVGGHGWPAPPARVWATSVSSAARRSDGEPTMSSMSSGANRTTGSAVGQRARPARRRR